MFSKAWIEEKGDSFCVMFKRGNNTTTKFVGRYEECKEVLNNFNKWS